MPMLHKMCQLFERLKTRKIELSKRVDKSKLRIRELTFR